MSVSQRFLWRRRAVRMIWVLVLAAVILSRRGGSADDWAKFNQQTFVVVAVSDDGQIVSRSVDGSIHQVVNLLGVGKPSSTYLRDHLVGKTVTLMLDSPQTRDDHTGLLVYIFVSDAENLNVQIVRDGFARADWKQDCLLASEIRSAQSDAKKNRRGLWAQAPDVHPGLRVKSQPAFAG